MIFMKLFLFFSLLSSLFAETPTQKYSLGEGVQVAQLPLYVGGYFSADYRGIDGNNSYRLNDLALLSYGAYSKFSYLAEIEYKNFYLYNENAGKYTSSQDRRVHTERLYLHYELDERNAFTLGKYNTPAGFWNLLPINVLRETTSIPQSTMLLFPTFTTGVLWNYKNYGDATINVDIIAQNNADLDPTYNNYKLDEHYALGIAYEKDNLQVKLNFGFFDGRPANDASKALYYYMASLKYATDTLEILAELGSQKSTNVFTTKYAGYLQGVYKFTQKHAGVLRLESYDDRVHSIQEEIAIFAYSYRPIYPVSLKMEYQFHSVHQNNQVQCSVSVLF